MTLLLAGIGFLLAIGRYSIGAYLWPEAIFVVGTIAAGIVFFSRTVRRQLTFVLPFVRRAAPREACARRLRGDPRLPRSRRDAARRLGRHGRAAARSHRSRSTPPAARSESSSRRSPTSCSGPLLFLVMLVPFTVNGLGVREAFFVSFLGNLGVPADQAFACGFLFFVMTIVLAVPGLAGHPLGERLRPARAGSRAKCLTSRSSSSPGTHCRGSSNVSSPSPART